MTRHRSLALALALVLEASGRLLAQDVVWIEAEVASAINVKPNVAGWGNKGFLSGEAWLNVNVDAAGLKALPPGGAKLRYEFTTAKEGSYEVWNRLGFEFVRSPFSWRVDGGTWAESKPEALTTDLMEIDFFCEVAWLKLGDRPAGEARPACAGDRGSRQGQGEGRQGRPRARAVRAPTLICIDPGTLRPRTAKVKPGDRRPGTTPRTARPARSSSGLPDPPADGGRSLGRRIEGDSGRSARHDEQQPGEVAAPIKPTAPEAVRPMAGDRRPGGQERAPAGPRLRPSRLVSGRAMEVPRGGGRAGRSFLVFPQNNLNTTVYRQRRPSPGSIRIRSCAPAVGCHEGDQGRGSMRSWWASATPGTAGLRQTRPNPLRLRKTFNMPKKFFGDGFQDLAYPVWNAPQVGHPGDPRIRLAPGRPTPRTSSASRRSPARPWPSMSTVKPTPAKRAIQGDVRMRGDRRRREGSRRRCSPKAFSHRSPRRMGNVVAVAGAWADAATLVAGSPRRCTACATTHRGRAARLLDVSRDPLRLPRVGRSDGIHFLAQRRPVPRLDRRRRRGVTAPARTSSPTTGRTNQTFDPLLGHDLEGPGRPSRRSTSSTAAASSSAARGCSTARRSATSPIEPDEATRKKL